MTRGLMRALLRRRLNERTPDQWADSDLNELLNYGLQQTQKYVLAVNPEAVLYVDVAHVVANQELYAWPQGMLYELELALVDPSTGQYVPMERCNWDQTRGRVSDARPQYAHHGRYFGLSPIPAANVSAGLQLRWIPTLEMASDSDVPPILSILHPAIVVWAQKLALGETGEQLEEVRKEIKDIVEDTGRFYLKSASTAPALQPAVSKGY